MLQLLFCEVIFSVLIAKLELAGLLLLQLFLGSIELFFRLKIGGAAVIIAFVNRFQLAVFPAIQRPMAMRTPVFGLLCSAKAFADLREVLTNFAEYLCSFLAVIVIEIRSGSAAVVTNHTLRHTLFFRPPPDGQKRTKMYFEIGCQ